MHFEPIIQSLNQPPYNVRVQKPPITPGGLIRYLESHGYKAI